MGVKEILMLLTLIGLFILMWKLQETNWERLVKKMNKSNVLDLIKLAESKSITASMGKIEDARTKKFEEEVIKALKMYHRSVSHRDKEHYRKKAMDYIYTIKYYSAEEFYTPPFE